MSCSLPTRWSVVFLLCSGLLATGCGGSMQNQPPPLTPPTSLFIKKAREALQAGNPQQALVLTDSARQHAPNHPAVYLTRGKSLNQLQQFEQAEKAYHRVLEHNPAHPRATTHLGNLAFQQEQYQDALNWYEKALKSGPSTDLLGQLGHSYVKLSKRDSAIWAFKKAVAFDSTFSPGYGWLAQLYRTNGNQKSALRYARQALELAPDNEVYRYLVGFLSFKTGHLEKAVPHLRKIIQEQPWQHAAHYNLGQALLQLGKTAEAQKYLAQADSLQQVQSDIQQLQSQADKNPRHPQAWVQLGDALYKTGRLQKALDAYKNAYALAPNHSLIQQRIQKITGQQKRPRTRSRVGLVPR